jgi:hypothetical protein
MPDKLPYDEIRKLMALCPDRSMVWQHYQGSCYRVLGVAVNEADQTPLVVYRHDGSGCVFARPLKEWSEPMEGDGTRRFRPVGKIGIVPADVGGW